MSPDMCVPCGDGLINVRVGAIIMKAGKLLMVKSVHGYYYSVGGRVKFGETAREAVVREVFEETGVRLEAKRLAFVHENYFHGDAPANTGKLIYELCFYFLMDVPDGFAPVNDCIADNGGQEPLCWVPLDTTERIYPEFFKTELAELSPGVKCFAANGR